jgi:hypothetical protein
LLLVEASLLGDAGEHVDRADVLALLKVRRKETFDHLMRARVLRECVRHM